MIAGMSTPDLIALITAISAGIVAIVGAIRSAPAKTPAGTKLVDAVVANTQAKDTQAQQIQKLIAKTEHLRDAGAPPA